MGDLLNPSLASEKTKHKLKKLIQAPNSYFMDVKCPGCLQITTVYSHAQSVVLCNNCNVMLCKPTGGKARLSEISRVRGWARGSDCTQGCRLQPNTPRHNAP